MLYSLNVTTKNKQILILTISSLICSSLTLDSIMEYCGLDVGTKGQLCDAIAAICKKYIPFTETYSVDGELHIELDDEKILSISLHRNITGGGLSYDPVQIRENIVMGSVGQRKDQTAKCQYNENSGDEDEVDSSYSNIDYSKTLPAFLSKKNRYQETQNHGINKDSPDCSDDVVEANHETSIVMTNANSVLGAHAKQDRTNHLEDPHLHSDRHFLRFQNDKSKRETIVGNNHIACDYEDRDTSRTESDFGDKLLESDEDVYTDTSRTESVVGDNKLDSEDDTDMDIFRTNNQSLSNTTNNKQYVGNTMTTHLHDNGPSIPVSRNMIYNDLKMRTCVVKLNKIYQNDPIAKGGAVRKGPYPEGSAGRKGTYSHSAAGKKGKYPEGGAGRKGTYSQSGAGKKGTYSHSGAGKKGTYPEGGAGTKGIYPQGVGGRQETYLDSVAGRMGKYLQTRAGRRGIFHQSGAGRKITYSQSGARRNETYPENDARRKETYPQSDTANMKIPHQSNAPSLTTVNECDIINKTENNRDSLIQKQMGNAAKMQSRKIIHEHHKDLHRKTCSASKQFKCRFCEKPFAAKFTTFRHEQSMHTDKLQFQCHICWRRYESHVNIEKHYAFLHPNEHYTFQEVVIKCTKCGKLFNHDNHSSLKKHDQICHVCKGTYQCKVCSRCFNQKRYLVKHIRRKFCMRK